VSEPVAPSVVVTRSPRPLVTVPEHSDPVVSFVIVTYGTGPIVIDAIGSLVRSLTDELIAYDVLVVDNEHPTRPNRTLPHLLLDTSGVVVIRPGRNLGFAGGCNTGVAHGRGSIIGLVNADVEFSTGWLPPLIHAIGEDAAIAAPVLLEPDGTVQSAGHRLWSDGTTSPITTPIPPGGMTRPDYASAACWVLSRSVFTDVGGFDESFHPAYFEDVDLALRAGDRGGTVVVGDSTVIHHRGASTATTVIPDTTPQRLRLLEKWPTLTSTQPARPASIPS
jgi:GT2 family glycosyltransferase